MLRAAVRLALTAAVLGLGAFAQSPAFTLDQVMGSAFPTSLTAAATGEHIAWTADQRGVRNVFVADGPAFVPRQLTRYTADDGQPISAVHITPDGKTVVYARGSERNNLGDSADPDSDVDKPEQQVWSVRAGAAPRLLGEMGCTGEDCESIELSPDGQWAAWPARNTIWVASTDGKSPARALAWSQGDNTSPRFSPDSKSVAFVTIRPGHAFIAVYEIGSRHLRYIAPSVDRDSNPRWSPDGRAIIFERVRGLTAPARGRGAPAAAATPATNPPTAAPAPQLPRWELWIAAADGAEAHPFWHSGVRAQDGTQTSTLGHHLEVGAGHLVFFNYEADGWNHLYAVSYDAAAGSLNDARLLTPGEFDVEDATLSRDGAAIIFSSNQDDIDRRHLWQVPLAGGAPVPLSRGETIEWTPVQTGDGRQIVCLGSTATTPAMPYVLTNDGRTVGRRMIGALPADFPAARLVTPAQVVFASTDNFQIHGQLFLPAHAAAGPMPTLIFVHGGSQRQMLLGFHYMDYYHNAYAENQYLVSRGFIVLSINYRTGIMYGRAFRLAPRTGRAGAQEYNDVVAAANYLKSLPQVDPARMGIWGGSYGGFLTAMALAKNSDLFAAGVDFHGVHDWSTNYSGGGPPPANLAPAAAAGRGAAAPINGSAAAPLNGSAAAPAGSAAGAPNASAPPADIAFQSSPDAWVSTWRSPVLLIQGDDDRNVAFGQMIDLVDRLRGQRVPFETLVLPDEIHGFLRWQSWMRAYTATTAFFQRVLVNHEAIAAGN